MLNQSFRQSQEQSLRPLTTAHLAQTMSLLLLSRQELKQKVESEISTNPALEVVDMNKCPSCSRPLIGNTPCSVCRRNGDNVDDTPIIFVSSRSDFVGSSSKSQSADDISPDEITPAMEELHTYVLRQAAPDLETQDIPIAAHILSSLNDDGLLSVPIVEIAQYHHVPISRIEKVNELIKRCEPVGVGSTSPLEALLVQTDVLSETNYVPPLASRAITEGMELLSRHSYTELGRLLSISADDAREIARFISENLNPYPARSHWGNIRDGSASKQDYQSPDVIISILNHPKQNLVVEIISPYTGRLRINPLFRDAIREARSENAEKWQADLEKASLLIKCLQQRNNTLVRLMHLLVEIQHDFILQGDIHLVPITRASLADKLNVHESTISRAVSGKMLQLPNKSLIPMSKLFDRSLRIRAEMINIILEEIKPLNDSQIADILNERGFSIARRTVAKYRAIEGILASRMRWSMHSSNPE